MKQSSTQSTCFHAIQLGVTLAAFREDQERCGWEMEQSWEVKALIL